MLPVIEKTNSDILINGKPVYFYQGNYAYCRPDQIEIKTKQSGYDFIIKSPVPTAMVIPCFQKHISIGDSYQYIDTNINEQYYCPGPTKIMTNENCQAICSGSVHLIDDVYWTFSCFGEVKISYFKKFYEQYISITGVPDKEVMIFHLDVGYNFMPNIAYHSPPRKSFDLHGIMSKEEIEFAVYYGAKINKIHPNLSDKIASATEIQKLFNDHELYSVLSGSLAEYFNGIKCSIKDIDFMLKTHHEMVAAADLLESHGFKVIKTTPKWISLVCKDVSVDLSYDNYRILPSYVKYDQSIRYLDSEGLMSFCLLNLQEQQYTGYLNSYPRNQKAIFEVTSHNYKNNKRCNSTLAQEFIEYEKYTEGCIKICHVLSQNDLLFKDTRINNPFRVNAFGNDKKRFFSVINLGSVNDCRLVTDFIPDSALWEDVSGYTQEARVEKYGNFSIIFVDQIHLPGVVECK